MCGQSNEASLKGEESSRPHTHVSAESLGGAELDFIQEAAVPSPRRAARRASSWRSSLRRAAAPAPRGVWPRGRSAQAALDVGAVYRCKRAHHRGGRPHVSVLHKAGPRVVLPKLCRGGAGRELWGWAKRRLEMLQGGSRVRLWDGRTQQSCRQSSCDRPSPSSQVLGTFRAAAGGRERATGSRLPLHSAQQRKW